MSAFNRHAINNPVMFDPSQDRSLFPVEDRPIQQQQQQQQQHQQHQHQQQQQMMMSRMPQAPMYAPSAAPVYVHSAPAQAPAPIIVHTNAPAPASAPIIVNAGRGRGHGHGHGRGRRRRLSSGDRKEEHDDEYDDAGEDEVEESDAESEGEWRSRSDRMARRARLLRNALLGSRGFERSSSTTTLVVCVLLVMIVLVAIVWLSRRRDSYPFAAAPGPMMQHPTGAWMPTAMVMQAPPPTYVYGGASVGDTMSMASRPIVSHYVSQAPWTPLMPTSSLAL